MTATCVMVLGTTSGAGKSWVTTALCRHYARQGLKVAPFKAQNMSNNARVVAALDGTQGEIGSAQYFQALAAGAEPDVRMNPLLLKPEADTRSQVVLLGRVSAELGALPWRGRSEKVWPQIAQALDALRTENDVVVIEGAGSPAEINLHASDIVNMRVACHAQARMQADWPQGWQGLDLGRARVHQGLIVSGDRFVSRASESQALRRDLPDALAVEMEGAAVAQVCRDHGVPFAAVRLISDRADDQAHPDFLRLVQDLAAPFGLHLIDHLLQKSNHKLGSDPN